MPLRVSNALWLISDTHFGHRNIEKFEQRPASHEAIIMSNWIDRVGEQDHILHLGDLALGQDGNRKRWLKVIERLPGRKFLIMGNHDKEVPQEYEYYGFTVVEPFIWGIRTPFAFSHFPHSTSNPIAGFFTTNIHGHIHKNPLRPEDGHIDTGKRYINVSVENTDLAPVQFGNVVGCKKYDTEFEGAS